MTHLIGAAFAASGASQEHVTRLESNRRANILTGASQANNTTAAPVGIVGTCGNGSIGNGVCPDGTCRTISGYCGKSIEDLFHVNVSACPYHFSNPPNNYSFPPFSLTPPAPPFNFSIPSNVGSSPPDTGSRVKNRTIYISVGVLVTILLCWSKLEYRLTILIDDCFRKFRPATNDGSTSNSNPSDTSPDAEAPFGSSCFKLYLLTLFLMRIIWLHRN